METAQNGGGFPLLGVSCRRAGFPSIHPPRRFPLDVLRTVFPRLIRLHVRLGHDLAPALALQEHHGRERGATTPERGTLWRYAAWAAMVELSTTGNFGYCSID
jgi:hypothetical protein